MSEPKAKWKLYSDGDWCADIGSYSVNAAPDRGAWWVDSTEGELASAEKPGPCDVVTLMLAAESALATHLRAVADTMTWPEVESESLGPTEFVDCLTWQPPADNALIGTCSFTVPATMDQFTNNGPTAIYVESLAPPPMQACPNCMTMTAEHKLGCPRKPTSCECCAADNKMRLTGTHNRSQPSSVASRHGPSCSCVGCVTRVRTIASLQRQEAFCGITDGVRTESGEALVLAKVGGGAIGEVISNTGESTIYVRGMRIAPGVKLTFKHGVAMPLIGCAHCLQMQIASEHENGCPYTRPLNNKKPPTPEGTGGGR